MDNGPATTTQSTPLHLTPTEALVAELQRRGWVLTERIRNRRQKPVLVGPGREVPFARSRP